MDIGGVASTNPAGGHDIHVQASKSIGCDKHGATAGVFAAGNTHKGPVTTGAFAGVNANGHGLSVQHSSTPNMGQTLAANAQLNLHRSAEHQVDVNAFHRHNQLNNGFKFDQNGGNLAWQHQQGHAASLGVTHVPQFNMTTMDAAAKANLWSSPNRASTLDMTGTAQRHLSGPLAGKNNFGAGLGFTHRF